MYNIVAKRILAGILTFCMIGNMPDFTLLAAGTGSEAVDQVGTEAEAVTEEAPSSYDDLIEPYTDGKISLQTSEDIGKPKELPSQVKSKIQEGFLAAEDILGLTITYQGTPLKQIDETEAEAGVDGYTVSAHITGSGNTATLTVTGSGLYEDFITYYVDLGENIGDCTVALKYDGYNEGTTSYSYEGRAIEPDVEVRTASGAVVDPDNYTVDYQNNVNVGSASVVISGQKGSNQVYAGIKTVGFTITPADISLGTLFQLECQNAVYNKAKVGTPDGITPYGLSVKNILTGEAASESDYALTYNNSKQLSSAQNPAQVRVNGDGGNGNCTGVLTKTYQINKASFDEAANEAYSEDDQIIIKVDKTQYEYTGSEIEPAVTVYQKDEVNGLLVERTDYEVIYEDNINVGTGHITFNGIGNYEGSRTVEFTIGQYDISKDERILQQITLDSDGYEYSGSEIVPEVPRQLTASSGQILEIDKHYRVSYARNINVGDGIVRIIGTDNYTGELDLEFVIWKDMTGNADITIDRIPDQLYTGKPIQPSPVVKDKGAVLEQGTHYNAPTYPSADYIGVGQNRQISITGDGKYYKGSVTAQFNIVPRAMDSLKAEFLDAGSFIYNGSGIKKPIKITDASGQIEFSSDENGDFNITYRDENGNPSDCINAGNYQVWIEPKSDKLDCYEGESLSLPFTILQKALENDTQEYTVDLLLNGTKFTETSYTGEDIIPTVSILDKERNTVIDPADYDVAVTNNRNYGRATVTVKGKRNYTGTITASFRITRKNLSQASVSLLEIDPDKYIYTGKPIVPSISKLVIDTRELSPEEIAEEFLIESSAVNVGDDGSFTLTGMKNYEGSISSGNVKFTIEQQDIASSDVWVEPIGNWPYEEGVAAEPIPSITYNGTELVLGTDFRIVEYHNNTDKDYGVTDPDMMPSVTIEGIGNFKGERTEIFHIRESLANAVVTGMDDLSYTYTSREIQPVPTSVVLDGETLILNEDYSVTYKNNINAADMSAENHPTIVIAGINEYGGTKEFAFTITRQEISLRSVGALNAPMSYKVGNSPGFTGSPILPTLTITYNATDPITNANYTYVLVEGVDYDFSNSTKGNINATTGAQSYTITIQPKGNFRTKDNTGSFVDITRYTIKPKPITSADLTISDIEVDGSVQMPARPEVSITDAKRTPEGAYQEEGDTCYDLVLGTDYTVGYKNNTAPGMATATITGIGNYSGTVTRTFVIPGNLGNADIKFLNSTSGSSDSGKYWYTGSAITPQIQVTVMAAGDGSSTSKTLTKGTDYDLEIVGDNINHGKPKIRLVGKGAYEGTTREIDNFEILSVPLNDAKVSIKMAASVNYVDEFVNVWPEATLMLGRYTLQEGIDFTCEYEKYCWRPTAISGKRYTVKFLPGSSGNFTGSAAKEYTIGNNFNVEIRFADTDTYTYTGEEICPRLIVTDPAKGYELKYVGDLEGEEAKKGADYDVTYSDNINVGTVTVTVFGLGGQEGYSTQYCGSKTITFKITGKNLGDDDIEIGSIDEYTYTSKEIKPEPTVLWKGHGADGSDVELEAGVDFKYVYSSNINAGTATVGIEPMSNRGNFTRSKEKTFTIQPKNLEDEDVTLEGIPDQIYTGKPITPNLNIHWGLNASDQVVVKSDDYSLHYGTEDNENQNLDVGTVGVTIEGKGNYTGTITTEFRIVKVKLSDIIPEYEMTQQWTGKQITPDIALKYYSTDGDEITMNSPELWGYVITYGENQMLGTTSGSITITADPNGNCEGDPVVWRFAIVQRHIDDETVALSGLLDSYELDEKEQKCEPKPILTFKPDVTTSYTLREGYDYTLSYEENTHVTHGDEKAKITITGIGNFDSSFTREFRITNDLIKYINQDETYVNDVHLEYNGQTQHPDVTIDFSLNSIREGTDYELVWDKDRDEDCISAGVHTVTITGIGEYSGELELTFTISPRDISHIDFTIEPQVYIGSPIEPVVIGIDSELSEDVLGGDIYEITAIQNNTEVGEASISIKAVETSNYTGTRNLTFDIVKADLGGSYISSSVVESPQKYTGSEIQPEFTIMDTRRNSTGGALLARDDEYYLLVEGVDYEVEYSNNIYPKLDEDSMPAVITITGIGNYEGTLTKMFDIQADLEDAEIAPIPGQPYTGEEVRPELTVTLGDRVLRLGFDYTVEYFNNIDRGVATAVITAVGGTPYTGSQSVTFSISRDLDGAQVFLIDTVFTYTGEEIRPVPAVVFDDMTLTAGVDYEVSYENNVNVGTANVLIRGIGGYDGSISATFEIIKRSIIRCDFENIVEQTYVGKATAQDVVVTDGGKRLTLDQDYSLTYADNARPGIATIEVAGMGNYGGIKTIHYLINVTNMTTIRATGSKDSIRLSWTGVPGAQGYAIYDTDNDLIARTTGLSYTHANLDAMTAYAYKVRPYVTVGSTTYYGGFSNTVQAATSIAAPVISLKAAKKKITVSWKRINGVSGYEIYRSKKKSKGYKKFRTAKKVSITSYTNKGLSRKTKYFYRVRAYKTVNGKKVYSSYSSPKSVKTK